MPFFLKSADFLRNLGQVFEQPSERLDGQSFLGRVKTGLLLGLP